MEFPLLYLYRDASRSALTSGHANTFVELNLEITVDCLPTSVTFPLFRPLSILVALFLVGGCDDKDFDDGEMMEGDTDVATDGEASDGDAELPPNREGSVCPTLAAAQECSDGEYVGVQVCNGEEYGTLRWGPCFIDECSAVGDIRSCTTDEGKPGIERCIEVSGFPLTWGVCAPDVCEPGVYNCNLGEPFETWTWTCELDAQGASISDKESACYTPLVLAFDERPVEFTAPSMTAAFAFDIAGDGLCTSPDWPTAATPWLARDLNKNGTIDDGGELFGSGTVTAGGGPARNGFEALAEFDADRDGAITPADPIWPELLVWSDYDGDRRATGWELVPLSTHSVDSLPLEYNIDTRCDARGNCSHERASFTYRRGDASAVGQLVDVYLTCE